MLDSELRQLSVRLPGDVLVALKVKAAEERKTVTEVLGQLVREYLNGSLAEAGAVVQPVVRLGRQEVAGSSPARQPASVSVPDEDEEEERVVKGCLDHRGDPDEFCEACLAMEAV